MNIDEVSVTGSSSDNSKAEPSSARSVQALAAPRLKPAALLESKIPNRR